MCFELRIKRYGTSIFVAEAQLAKLAMTTTIQDMDPSIGAKWLIAIELAGGTVMGATDAMTQEPASPVPAYFPAQPCSKPADGHEEEHATHSTQRLVGAVGVTGAVGNLAARINAGATLATGGGNLEAGMFAGASMGAPVVRRVADYPVSRIQEVCTNGRIARCRGS